jgi:hypothetical protein
MKLTLNDLIELLNAMIWLFLFYLVIKNLIG